MSINSSQRKTQLNPNNSVDCVIFGFDFEQIKVLLIDRGQNLGNSKNQRALPGNLIYEDEDLDQAAYRVLEELTGINDIYLEQVGAFGNPNRISKESDLEWLKSIRDQPNARVITAAYYSLVKIDDFIPKPHSFAKKAEWISITEINELAFDHFEILQVAKEKLKQKIKIQPIGFNLLPEKFT